MGFGIMIPLIYNYGKQFGLNQQTLGLLTATYSVAQFFATPLLGSLSDRFGRRPLLMICLAGTCASFVLFGLAKSILVLFAARILDGLTGGDISVAQAMIADISAPGARSRNFGILGSAFGFGYVIGPAAGGLLSRWGMTVPFFFAAGLALTGVLISYFFLRETHGKKTRHHQFKYRSLLTAISKPVTGPTIMTGFLLTTAQFTMLIGFQAVCSDMLKLSAMQTGLFYAGFGLSGIVMQLAVPLIQRLAPQKSFVLLISTFVCLGAIIFTGMAGTLWPFALGTGLYGLFNGLRNPMLNAIIADHSAPAAQGEIMGINQSYTSIGQTLGPAAAGLAALVSLHSVFFLAALFMLAASVITVRLKIAGV
jgi:predicted MFS family arabinose efflux permease